MGKAFVSNLEIKNGKVYAVTELIHNHTPSDYGEPVIQSSVDG